MFIVWGKRVTRKKVGYVADFCPMCRDAQTFLLKEVRVYSHVYYIPTSTSALHGYERTCQGCTLPLSGAPRQYVAAPKKPAHVDDILARSFPAFDEVYGERLKIEESLRLAPDSLPVSVRRALIQQPFLVLAPLVEARARQTSFDAIATAALLGGLLLAIGGGLAASNLPQDYAGPAVGACALGGLALIIWGMASTARRYARGKLAPQIAKTLRPLRPSDKELSTTLAELKQKGHRIGKILKPQHVAALIAAG